MLHALAPLGVHVLVIDDNSPDGTGEIADRLAAELGFVSVLHRERKEGLGPAYLAGFRRALADGAEFVLEMDCDFSHDPEDVPRLIAACEAGADLALGSRYVAGRRNRELGPRAPAHLRRRIVLRARAARREDPRPHRRLQVLPPRRARAHRPRRDPLQGLRVPDRRRRTERCAPGSRVVEVPIVFADRTAGHSKMSHAIVLEAVTKVPALRLAALQGTSSTLQDLDAAAFDTAIAGRTGRRRLLGAVVQAVPRDRADPRGARRERGRPCRVREAEHRRASRDRRALRGALDPDRDALRGRQPREHGDRRAPARPLRARFAAWL